MAGFRTVERRKRAARPKFIEAVKECGNILHAAKAIGIPRYWHYEWMKNDPEYINEFDAAIDESVERLELEAYRRAHAGTDKPVFYKGECCGHIREYSDNLLMFLLKAARPDKYRDRQTIDQTVTHSQPIEVRVLEDDNWYGNANLVPTESTTASDPTAVIPGPVQDHGERATVGQDRFGSNGSDAGSRTETGSVSGSD